MCFIKPANYDQKKTSKFRKQVRRIENMEYDPKEDWFTCVQGRKLHLRRQTTEVQDGQFMSPPGTGVKIVADAHTGHNATRPRYRINPRRSSSRKPSGKNGNWQPETL